MRFSRLAPPFCGHVFWQEKFYRFPSCFLSCYMCMFFLFSFRGKFYFVKIFFGLGGFKFSSWRQLETDWSLGPWPYPSPLPVDRWLAVSRPELMRYRASDLHMLEITFPTPWKSHARPHQFRFAWSPPPPGARGTDAFLVPRAAVLRPRFWQRLKLMFILSFICFR